VEVDLAPHAIASNRLWASNTDYFSLRALGEQARVQSVTEFNGDANDTESMQEANSLLLHPGAVREAWHCFTTSLA
jgi:hypothetical protein